MKTVRPEHALGRARLRHAGQFWQQYLTTATLPQLDGWLAREMKKQRAFGKQDRYWYS